MKFCAASANENDGAGTTELKYRSSETLFFVPITKRVRKLRMTKHQQALFLWVKQHNNHKLLSTCDKNYIL